MLQWGDKVLVALSGGADSVALLLLLQKAGYECEAIHCNFHLRGEESMRDEEFVRSLCHAKNTPLTVVDFDTLSYAHEKGISIEMAARELRYEAFEKHRQERGAAAIAVAHHRNDSAETLLLNLLRGTGIRGLRGIKPRNGHIVRPLLCVGRDEILNYLNRLHEDYVTDSSNLQTDFTRNKIRLEIIPLMQKINPSIVESLAETAERLSEAEKVYSQAIAEGTARVTSKEGIDIERLKHEPSPQALLFEILQPKGFNGAQAADIFSVMDTESGRTFASEDWEVVKDRTKFIVIPKTHHDWQGCTLNIDDTTATAYGTITCSIQEFDGTIEKEKNIARLDYYKIAEPLYVRVWQKGDRFTPFGMRGSKLVSDYLTDRKMSLADKRKQLVVCDATGEIVWLVNERPSARCCTGKETKKTIRMEWKNNN